METHHGELGIQGWIDAKLKVITGGCAGTGGDVAHGFFWDATVAGENG